MDTVTVFSSRKTECSFTKSLIRLALGFSLTLLAANHAAAQYGGGGGGTTGGAGSPGYTPPPGGYSSAKGVGIGVGAAAGAGVLYLTLHHRGYVTGCVQPADDGLRLVDAKKNKSYHLIAGGVLLKPGQRVELKGQKSKDKGGTETFEARKLVKNLGVCETPSPANPDRPAAQ